MKPPKSVFDKDFIYTNSDKTDIRATFDRIRKELECNSTTAAVKPDGSNKQLPRSGNTTSMKPSGNVLPLGSQKKP